MEPREVGKTCMQSHLDNRITSQGQGVRCALKSATQQEFRGGAAEQAANRAINVRDPKVTAGSQRGYITRWVIGFK